MNRQRRSQSRLHKAVTNGDLAKTRYLVEHKGVNIEGLDTNCRRPVLHTACIMGNLDMATYLVESGGANVHAIDGYGKTCLFAAALEGHVDIVRYLLQHGGHVLMAVKDENGDTLLHWLMYGNELDVVRVLLDACCDELLFEKNNTGQTALYSARSAEMVQLLLEKGGAALVEQQDSDGSTALFFLEHLHAAKHLVEAWGANIFHKNEDGDTPLHYAAGSNKATIAAYLAQKGGPELVDAVNESGWTALQHAAGRRLGFLTVKALVESGKANIYAAEWDFKSTALHCAIGCHNMDAACYLAQLGGATLVLATDGRGMTALHSLASLAGQVDIARVLVEAGGGSELIYMQDRDGSTALHKAARFVQLSEYLLSVGGNDLMNVVDNDGLTAFHCYAKRGQIAMILWSLDYVSGFDVNLVDTMGRTALHHAGCLATMQCLVQTCSSSINVVDSIGRTVLHVASLTGSAEMVAFLVDSYSGNVNATDNDGSTALHMACASEKDSLAKACILIAAGAETDATNVDGHLALHMACTKSKNVHLIRLLLGRFDIE